MNLYLAEDNEFINELSKIILDNLGNENFGVDELIKVSGVNSNFLRSRIKSIEKITVTQFITKIRLEKAREFLLEGIYTAAEVSYNVGFSSPSYFTRCFHDLYGYPPSEVKNHLTPGKTEKPKSKTPEPKPAGKKRWIQMAISAAVFVGVFTISSEVFFYRSFTKDNKTEVNTIAVLPFINDSGEEFAPFTTWMGLEIGNKLGKIENVLVVPQSTTEIYRNSKKSNRDIARELMVEYILRGRTIKTGNKILLNVELLDAKNGQSILSEMYERDLNLTEETALNRIFEICGDVVFQITGSLKTNLSSNEIEELAKLNPKNMAALRAFQQANLHGELSALNDPGSRIAFEELMKAKKLCEEAIKIDSTFADAQAMLGHIYINILPFYANIYLADKYLDTGKIYVNKALRYDGKNIAATNYLRMYYIEKGLLNEADKLLPITDNRVKNYSYYETKHNEFKELNDQYHALEAFLSFIETKPPDMPIQDYLTNRVFYHYLSTGFPIRARELNEEILKTVHDTTRYFVRKADWENNYGSKDSALMIYRQLDKKGQASMTYLYFAVQYFNFRKENTKALDTMQKLEEKVLLAAGSIPTVFLVGGYTYLKNGMKEKADYHFKGSIKRAEDEIKLNSINARRYISHFNLALIYSILNDKPKSLQYLEMIKQSRSVPLNFINDLKTNPMFDNVREEPEFQKITRALEKKYNEQHEKIKKLLISRGLEPV